MSLDNVADTSVGFDREVIEQHTRPLYGRYASMTTFQRDEQVRATTIEGLAADVQAIIG